MQKKICMFSERIYNMQKIELPQLLTAMLITSNYIYYTSLWAYNSSSSLTIIKHHKQNTVEGEFIVMCKLLVQW